MSIDTKLIEQSFGKVSFSKEQFTELFYSTLFERYPAVKPLFANTDIAAQQTKLFAALAYVVRNLKSPDVVVSALEELGAKHVGYGAQVAHFDAVGECILYSLEQVLGADWNEQTKSAWIQAYTFVADTMKSAMR